MAEKKALYLLSSLYSQTHQLSSKTPAISTQVYLLMNTYYVPGTLSDARENKTYVPWF